MSTSKTKNVAIAKKFYSLANQFLVEDPKCFTLCLALDGEHAIIGGETGELMEKCPFISYHRINDTFETVDLKLIKMMKDPIVFLKLDSSSGLIFGSDMRTNMVVLRISRTNDIQILRILDDVQADFAYDLAFY